MLNSQLLLAVLFIILVQLLVFTPFALAIVPETITIQGTLEAPGGGPLTGTYAGMVRIWDASVGGSLLANSFNTITLSDSGRFSLDLLLEDVFVPPDQAWYDLAVDTDNDGIEEEEYFPHRVRFHSVPFARLAANAELLGGYPASAFVQGGSSTGEGWSLDGNAASAGNFLGTTNSESLELRVNNARALALIPTVDSPNLVGGHDSNSVGPSVEGGTIGGGGSSTGPNEVTGHYGTVSGGRNNMVQGQDSTVSGGVSNSSVGDRSAVGGGSENHAEGEYSNIAGGDTNNALGAHSTVGGGAGNWARGLWNTVAGGASNSATGDDSSVGGGYVNQVQSAYGTIAGGWDNLIQSNSSTSFIGGGRQNRTEFPDTTVGGGIGNQAISWSATIGGGEFNSAIGTRSFVGGGYRNSAADDSSTVGGGMNNSAGPYATVGGGAGNRAAGPNAFIGGGVGNEATGGRSHTIAGGTENLATGFAATIGGGEWNSATGEWLPTVAGGLNNSASGSLSFVGGGGGNGVIGLRGNYAVGEWSAISGGESNTASGMHSAIPGGMLNSANGDYSFAAGRRAQAEGVGSFVWGDSADQDIYAWGDNQFVVRATGGFWFITAVDATGYPIEGMMLPTGTSGWVPIGATSPKAATEEVDTLQRLHRLIQERDEEISELKSRIEKLENLVLNR